MDRKIEDGCLSVSNVKDIIDKILFDNAGRSFNGTHDIRQIRRE